MTKYFLYGHYDSRGGGTLIERDTREEADAQYLEAFWTETEDPEETKKQIIEDDFIAEVAFSAHREVQDGEDIEYGPHEPDDKAELANAFEDGLGWTTPEIIEQVPNPYREMLWARYDEKDDVVELRLCPPNHHPAYEDQGARETPYHKRYGFPEPKKQPGWKRASFGEDACGVILMKKPA